MKTNILHFAGILLATSCLSPKAFAATQIDHIDRYDVCWNSPSQDFHGSMPLGNGDVAVNAWIDPSGELVFFISKTDSWEDNGRLAKVGKVRISLGDDLSMENFSQVLRLRDATLEARFGQGEGKTRLQLWVDANQPVIHVVAERPKPGDATASVELVRPKPLELISLSGSDLMEDRESPNRKREGVRVVVEPDKLLKNQSNRVGWNHRNEKSVGPDLVADLQGLDKSLLPEPLLHRTFGGIIKAENGQRIDDYKLRSSNSKRHHFKIFIHTEHPSTEASWIKAIEQTIASDETLPPEKHRQLHRDWWEAFWQRSRINVTINEKAPMEKAALEIVSKRTDPGHQRSKKSKPVVTYPNFEGEDDAFIVSRGYNLQRYLDACAGRGKHPIKFNGSLFSVPHEGDPDYRKWGPGYWWQNTRLPYISMCGSGDFDLMNPLFQMYAKDLLAVHKNRTNLQTESEGSFIPECIYFWGPQFTMNYGWTALKDREPDSHGDRLQASPWHKRLWVAAPELSFMMLDYYSYTQDQAFLKDTVLPAVNEFLTFFDSYYKTNADGELLMSPAMALETWWDCTNPAPELAGLHSLCKRLLALPESVTTDEQRAFWRSMQAKLPPLPTCMIEGKEALAPAARFADKQHNESPELYPVFPFRLVSFEKKNAWLGLHALEYRLNPEYQGWSQDNLFMAYLGLGKQAQAALVFRAKNRNWIHKSKNLSRFPAFWGPNRDWTPDQDHGGVLTASLQAMLLQVDPYSDKLFLLPAWPLDWNSDFKLHAPNNTIIVGEVVNGEVVNLKVIPESRRKDITILPCQ